MGKAHSWSTRNRRNGRKAVSTLDNTPGKQHQLDCFIGSNDWYLDLIDNAYDMIQCVDPQGRFVYVNRAWQTTLGYDQFEIDQLCIWDIIHPSHHEMCKKHFTALLTLRDCTLANIETIFVTKSKTDVFVEGCVTLRVVGGVPQHTRGIFRNVTTKKLVEQERDNLIAELREALARAYQLEKLVTVCAWTGKILHKGRWLGVDQYLTEQFGVRITHGMSDEALKKALTELEALEKRN
jgi:PAS domain S-box-containing protein